MADVLESLMVKLALDANDYQSGLSAAERQSDDFTKRTTSIFDGAMVGIGMQVTSMATDAISAIGSVAVESLNMASDLSETTSKVQTLFGDNAASIQAWAETADTAFGLSEQAALDAVGGLGNMFLQLGAGTEQAGDLSQSMVSMAADLASFHNAAGGTSEVLDTMAAAFRGEYDSVQRFIPTINAANVEQKALTMTNKESAKELTSLEKALAVQAILMEDAGAATGDFARTSEGMANQTRIMEAQWDNVQATLGQLFIPIAGAALDIINSFLPSIMDTVQGLVDWGASIKDIGDLFKVFEDGDGALMRLLTTLGMNEVAAQNLGVIYYELKASFETLLGPVIDLIAQFVSWQDVLAGVGLVVAAVILPALASMLAAAAPIIAIFAAAIAIVSALRYAWEQDIGGIQTFLSDAFLKIGDSIYQVRSWWEEHVGVIQSSTEGAFGFVQSFVTETLGYVVGWVEQNLPRIEQIVSTVMSAMTGFWQEHGDTIMALVGNTFQIVFTVIDTALKTVLDVVTLTLQLLTGDWQGAADTITGIGERFWDTVVSVFRIQLDTLTTLFSGFFDWLPGAAEGATSVVQSGWQSFTDWMSNHTTQGLSAAQSAWQTFSDTIIQVNSTMWEGVVFATEQGAILTQGAVTAGAQIMQGDWSGALETLRSTAETIWGNVYSTFQTQIDAVSGVIGMVDWLGLGESLASGIADGIANGAQWIVDAAQEAAQAALDAAKDWLGIGSPSKRASEEIGQPFSQGISVGAERAIPDAAVRIQNALRSMIGEISAPALPLQTTGSTGSITINVQLSGAATYQDGRNVGIGIADELRARGLA